MTFPSFLSVFYYNQILKILIVYDYIYSHVFLEIFFFGGGKLSVDEQIIDHNW